MVTSMKEGNQSGAAEHVRPEPARPQVPARSRRAQQAWQPTRQDLMRGRAALVQEFERPGNLSLQAYARLARKSGQQIYRDAKAHRLLALTLGSRGQRIPSWQLQSAPRRLTRLVLKAATPLGIDSWTLYHALTSRQDAFGGRTPIATVRSINAQQVAAKVCAALGIQRQPTQ
jgi:hypothetical protein